MKTEEITKLIDDEIVAPSADGWRVARLAKNRLEELEEKLSSIYRVAVGEDQVANDDTEGMARIAEIIAPSPKASNPHIIVGEKRLCVCGMYNGEPISCKDVLASMADLVKHANIKGSGVSLHSHDILRLESVISALVKDCHG